MKLDRPHPDSAGPFFDPLTRRRFLRFTGMAGLAASLAPLIACTGETSSTAPASGSASPSGVSLLEGVPGPGAVSGGTPGRRLIAGYVNEPDSNDPAQAVNLFSYDLATLLVFSGSLLAYEGQSGPPMANLAEMPEVSADGLTLTFSLRPGITFHNGREIEAADFKYSWERALSPEIASWGAGYIKGIAGAQDVIDGKTTTLDSLELVDAKTFRVTLDAPDFTFLMTCSQPFTAPVPQEEVERLGKDFAKTPVGFGPFMFGEFDEASQFALLVKNEDYHFETLPYVDEVQMYWGRDEQTLVQQVKSGDIHIIGDGISPSILAQVETDPALQPALQTREVNWNFQFVLNTAMPPLDDPAVRQAINYAVDRDAIVKVLQGAHSADGGPFPTGVIPEDVVLEPYGYDPERATTLLQEAGLDGGISLKLTSWDFEPWPTLAQIVQEQLKAVGITVEVETMKYNAATELADEGQLQMFPGGWYMVFPVISDIVDGYYVGGEYFDASAYEQLADDVRAQYEPEDQNPIYQEIGSILIEDAPALFLTSAAYNTLVSEQLQNFQYRGEYGNYYDRAWLA